MLFGEILEPSSRALIDDSNDYPEYKEPHYEWTVKSEVPLIIDSLVFVETKRINKLFLEFILVNSVPRCKLNDNLIIYEESKNFIVIYEGPKNNKEELTTGQIAETLKSWIEKAKQIFTITSSSFSSYQGEWSRDHSECVVKSLHTKNSINFNCQKLNTPNLITGLGASVLSYCIFKNLDCSSFICFINNAPIDSINSKPILDLAEAILSPFDYNFKITAPTHNLYM